MFAIGALSGCSLQGYGSHLWNEPEDVYHVIKAGETLGTISNQYGVSYTRIALLNGIRDPKDLQVGQEIFIGTMYVHASLWGPKSYESAPDDAAIVGLDSGGQISWPLKMGRLVSRFGRRGSSFHDGIDIATGSGTPVYAAHTARVIYSDNELSGYGNLLILRDNKGLVTVYAHNRRLLAEVGQVVRRGEKIAEVGQTGRASGPHLHFEVRAKNTARRYVAIDPLPLLTGSGTRPRRRVNENLTPILAKAETSR